MVSVRVRAVANVMGLRRGDEGDVETGTAHIDAMINAGYLQVIDYLPDPIPTVPAARFAQPNSFGEAAVVELPDRLPLAGAEIFEKMVADTAPAVEVIEEEVKPRGKTNSSKARSRPSRSRSAATRRPTGDAGDGSDAQPGLGDGPGGHGEPASPAPDEQAGGEA